MAEPGPDPSLPPPGGRLGRLWDELHDEQVPLPLQGPLSRALLEELDYARRPAVHERHIPTYGALVGPARDATLDVGPQRTTVVPMRELSLAAARRFADGRGAFLVRTPGREPQLACFEHRVEYEANLVELARRTGANAIRRSERGHVSVITPDTVVAWDGIRWLHKPHAAQFHDLVRSLVPDVDEEVLAALLELSVHWLSPAFRGTTLVWSLHRPARGLEGTDLQGALDQPPLTVLQPAHFPALVSIHGQIDGATLVDPDGTCRTYGGMLLPSREAVTTVPTDRGTRHTSARRYSYDHPGAILFVVSEDGPVSVYVDGARVVLVRVDHPATVTPEAEEADRRSGRERDVTCPGCGRTLIVDLPRRGAGHDQELSCPVCETATGEATGGASTRGVRTSAAARRSDQPSGA